MCVSKNLQIRGICISGALFYGPKILKCPKIISSFLCYRCFNAKIPHRSAGFLPASLLLMQVGGDNRTRICDLSRVRRALYRLSYASILETAKKGGDPDGTRTRVAAVKGRSLNRLTTGPFYMETDGMSVFYNGSGNWI